MGSLPGEAPITHQTACSGSSVSFERLSKKLTSAPCPLFRQGTSQGAVTLIQSFLRSTGYLSARSSAGAQGTSVNKTKIPALEELASGDRQTVYPRGSEIQGERCVCKPTAEVRAGQRGRDRVRLQLKPTQRASGRRWRFCRA